MNGKGKTQVAKAAESAAPKLRRRLYVAPSGTAATLIQLTYRHIPADSKAAAGDVTLQWGIKNDSDEEFLRVAREVRARVAELEKMNDVDFIESTRPPQA